MESPLKLSKNYSFRSTGKALRIYHDDAFEQVTFDIGGNFSWTDDNIGYSLTLNEIKQGESIGEYPDGTPGPAETSGIFEFWVNDGKSEPKTTIIEIKS